MGHALRLIENFAPNLQHKRLSARVRLYSEHNKTINRAIVHLIYAC